MFLIFKLLSELPAPLATAAFALFKLVPSVLTTLRTPPYERYEAADNQYSY